MNYQTEKVDEMALALLYLTLSEDRHAWKAMDWEVSERLFRKGWIANPVGKSKSFSLTEEGARRCEELFLKHFAKKAADP